MRLNDALIKAARWHQYQEVKNELSRTKMDKNNLNTALCEACDIHTFCYRPPNKDWFNIIDCLLSYGADINAAVQGRTPLGYVLPPSANYAECKVEKEVIPLVQYLLAKGAAPFVDVNVHIVNPRKGCISDVNMPEKEALNYTEHYDILKLLLKSQQIVSINLLINQLANMTFFPSILATVIANYAVEVTDPREKTIDEQHFDVFKITYPQFATTWLSLFGDRFNTMKKLLKEQKISSIQEVKQYVQLNPKDKELHNYMEYNWPWK